MKPWRIERTEKGRTNLALLNIGCFLKVTDDVGDIVLLKWAEPLADATILSLKS